MLAFAALVGTVILSVVAGFEFKIAGVVFGRNPDWQRSTQAQGDRLPDGVVVASTEQCALLGNGWVSFEDGQGRIILGVGSTEDQRGETRSFAKAGLVGGEFQHVLSVPELPFHGHPISVSQSTNIHDALAGNNDSASYGIDEHYRESSDSQNRWGTLSDVVGATGGGQPQNNMPPYITLYFCMKGGK